MSAQVMSSSNSNLHEMRVSKRQKGANGKELLEIISFDKISDRIRKVGQEANIFIDYISLVMKVVNQLYDKIPTSKIDELAAEQCASMSSIHPDYNILAGRIIISNHHKNTSGDFVEITKQLYEYTDMHGTKCPLVSKEQYANVIKYMYWSSVNGHTIDYSRDYLIDYFGFKTLDKSYLMKLNGVIVERPQDMWLRVSIGIHGDDCEKAHETYNLMSQKYFTHATPTLYNSGTPHPQLSSCFLQAMESDSIDGIFSTLKEVATISKWAGGIGLHIHNVRATGSHIRGTNGTSNGIVPMLRVFNNTAKYVDQCVVPETIIYTKNGPIQIQNCSIGETEIYNFYGETEVIQDILEHTYDGEMLEIKTMHSN